MGKSPVKYIIVTDKPSMFDESKEKLFVTTHDFITAVSHKSFLRRNIKVINLSGDYTYLSRGYYVSLLAEAKKFQSIPKIDGIVSLNWRRHHANFLSEINDYLEKSVDFPFEEPLVRTFTSFFGRHVNKKIEVIARKLFDVFRFPIVTFDLKYTHKKKWIISNVHARSFNSLLDEQIPVFKSDLDEFTGSAWKYRDKEKIHERYWVAILYNPHEKNPPSSLKTLDKFIKVGKKMGIWIELITKDDLSSLLEFDALLIRETTAINNHTYRFAQKAESEGIPTIDDTKSIIRCCNKIYLNELMEINGIDHPKSIVLDKKTWLSVLDDIDLPAVIKVPDGSFSYGVFKVSTKNELLNKAQELFSKSDFLLCQEFTPSEYDWRIGILNNQPLFASKYFMAEGHWQIYNHNANKKSSMSGKAESIAIEEVPDGVMSAALKVTKLIGEGLYGVDIKQMKDGRVLVIEVNDNPNIDMGIEDVVLKDQLYEKLLQHLVNKINK